MKFTKRAASFVGLFFLFVFALARIASDVKRLVMPLNDLTPVWVSAKAFVAGENPYLQTPDLEAIWGSAHIPSAEGCQDYNCVLHRYPMGYPPSALPVIAPFALLKWKTGIYVYLATSVSFFVFVLVLLARKSPLPWTDPRKLYIVAFGLAMAPFHAGVHHSNLNTLVVALLVAGVVFVSDVPYLSGIALGTALCLKPQVAFLFFAYPWVRRKWKPALTASFVFVTMTVCSVVWMSAHYIDIFETYLQALREFMPPGGMNSFYMASSRRYTMINLQVLVYQLSNSIIVSHIAAWTLFTLLTAATVMRICFRGSKGDDAIDLALISVLTLLPIYQQIYTAEILIFVIFWSMQNWRFKAAKAVCILMLPLLFPLAAMTWEYPPLTRFVESHQLADYFFWNAFVMPHVIWIEIALSLLLLGTFSNQNGEESPEYRL